MSTTARFTALILIVGFGIVGGSMALTASAQVYTVDGESITQNIGGDVQVSPHRQAVTFYDNETVYNASGTQLIEGEDYAWYTGNGTVHFYDTPSTTDGAGATISYAYEGIDDRTAALSSVMNTAFYGLVMVVLFVGGAAALNGIMGGL